ECVGRRELVAEQAGKAAERYVLVADREPRRAVERDADAVADLERNAVVADLRMELARDEQHRPALGGEADVIGLAGREIVGGVDMPASGVAPEYAVGQQMEIAGAWLAVERGLDGTVLDIIADRRPLRVIHAGV